MALRRAALAFPGQGSQRVGMGADLLQLWPRVAGDALDEASEAARLSLRRLMLEGPADRLALTAVAQPALLAHSIAVLRVLQHESGLEVVAPRVPLVLGHSLGEYSALVAADAIDFADAVRLVHHRGTAMQEAVPPGKGAMAALMPVSAADAEEVCALAADKTKRACQVANYNSSKQTVISGDKAAVEEAISSAKTLKKVRRAVLLDVSAPFHCELMAPAADALRLRLDELLAAGGIRSPQVPVVWNVEAEATAKTPEQISDVLTAQVTSPVKWSQSVDWCVAQGVTEFLELGAGGVLAGLIKQQAPTASVSSCGSGEQIRALLESWGA